ncbi:MAG: hypothetical protein ACRDQX_11495 [Pseudonocardiaceae bacterium]
MSGARVARVWLTAGLGTAPAPADQPTVRDDLMRTWQPGPDGRYSTGGAAITPPGMSCAPGMT